jgi:fructosamine-3-kinase
MTQPTSLRSALAAANVPDDSIQVEAFGGGDISTAWRATSRDGTSVVIKTFGRPPGANDDGLAGGVVAGEIPADLYELEAEGLNALRTPGGVRTPDVLAVTDTALVLELLEPAPETDDGFWARAGRMLATLHGVVGPRFGWHRDGCIGRLRQDNTWRDDGYEFFATSRILRWFDEPRVAGALNATDRAELERLCDRLPELVPPAPPTLTHGDLARSNILSDHGTPALIDPAVSWMWPDVDLSMIYCLGLEWPTSRLPEHFYDAYAEIRPLEDDWRDRMPLLHLRELLSLLAHFGNDRRDLAGEIRQIVHTYS